MKRNTASALIIACVCCLSSYEPASLADNRPTALNPEAPLLPGSRSPLHSAVRRQPATEVWPVAPSRREEERRLLSPPRPTDGDVLPAGLIGDALPISDHADAEGLAERQERPAIAYNSDDDEYLVVWQGFTASSKWGIYGQRLSANGTLLGGALIISSAADAHASPDAIYSAATAEYLVVWRDHRSSEKWDIYGQRVSGTGTPVGKALVVASEPEDQGWPQVMGPSFAICATSGDQVEAAAYVAAAQEYLILWADYRLDVNAGDIHGQRLSRQVRLTGSVFAAGTEDDYQMSPALPCHSDTGQLTVVWQDYRNENWDMYWQQVQVPVPGAYLPLVFK